MKKAEQGVASDADNAVVCIHDLISARMDLDVVGQEMKNLHQIVAIIAGLLLASGWFIFADSDRWNLGRIIFGIGMSVAATWTLIRQPMKMTRLVIVIILLPLLTTLVVLEAQEPTAGWPIALVWSVMLLGDLFLHTYLNRRVPGEAGTSKTGESDKPNKTAHTTAGNAPV